MKTIEELVQQLEMFSSEIVDLQKPTDEESLLKFEDESGIQLPRDYRNFLKLHNG